ncbi:MAG: FMN-binding protein, partial [Firmicutes bacterium]|nr:FMN-binding protein [Bacillota bacterium]
MLTLRTRRNVSLVLFIGLLLVSAAAWSMISEADGMKDGTYVGTAKGFGGDLIVDVTISDGKISEVAVRPHQETPFVADAALEQLTATVVEAQSASVDAVSGATVSSNALLEAVGKALKKATGSYEDGVYAGIAEGFGGDLIVDVTISDGKISEVAVRPHQETPFIADSALEELTAKIVEAQSTELDVISGATFTSNALLAAVQDALTGTGIVVVEVPEEPTASADAAFAINVGDGTHRGSAQGFGGELVLDVTVSGGKITEIVI